MREYNLRNPFSGRVLREKPDPASDDAAFSQEEPARRTLTVSQLAQKIAGIFDDNFASGIWVEGELSDPKVYPSGHLWFDLKDAGASVKSVMWSLDVKRLKFQPEQGLQVVCFGKVEYYAPRGEVKFIVRSIEPKGIGALQLAFEQLTKRLQEEGLFSEERKRPLPLFPERIGLVTSPRGAAIDDMLKVLDRRVEAVLFPTRVQGDGAAEAVARGIRELNEMGGLDLLIVGRGGGSLEDLWAFNEEQVARAIFRSELPVISAVGHEKDVTVSDLVADVRAATPTKAAEMVIFQRRACLDRLAAVLDNAAFTQPEEWIQEIQEQIEEIQEGLIEGLREPVLSAAHRLSLLHGDLLACSPQSVILQQVEKLHSLRGSLDTGMARSLEQIASRFTALTGRLNDLSPLKVLERGYSITFGPDGKILKEVKTVKPGDLIQTTLHKGSVKSRVESIGDDRYGHENKRNV